MGPSPNSHNRGFATRPHALDRSNAVQHRTPRTVEQIRTDALQRIQRLDAPNPQPTATTLQRKVAQSARPTFAYDEDATIESAPNDRTQSTVQKHPIHNDDAPTILGEKRSVWTQGTLIANRYELLEPLGAGAWGTIWKARQKGIDRFVAVKILKEREPQSMTKARSRFEREAKLASRIRHPSAVRILDFGYRYNQPYLVMEWLQGLTLQHFLRECGPLPPELIVDIGIGICGALHAAHQEGVIHRDLKPSNIMLVETSSGLTPVVVDFGLARTFAPDEATVTRDNMIVGTPAYMCPESIRGRQLTPTSDVYSLGVTFLTALMGENPFRGESGSVTMTNHLMERPVDTDTLALFGCSPVLARTLLSMVAIEPEDRPQAQVLAHHFQQLLDSFVHDGTDEPLATDELLEWSDQAPASAFDSESAPAQALPQDHITQRPITHGQQTRGPDEKHAVPAFHHVAQTSSDTNEHTETPTSFDTVQKLAPSKRTARPMRWVAFLLAGVLLTALGAAIAQQLRSQDADTPSAPMLRSAHAEGTAFKDDRSTKERRTLDARLVDSMQGEPSSPPFADTRDPSTTAGHTQEPLAPILSAKDAPLVDNAPPNEARNAAADSTEPTTQPTSSTNTAASPNDAPKTRASRASGTKRTPTARTEPATLILTLSPPADVRIGDKDYGLRSSLMLDDISSGRHTIRVERDGKLEERRVRLSPGKRHVESF